MADDNLKKHEIINMLKEQNKFANRQDSELFLRITPKEGYKCFYKTQNGKMASYLVTKDLIAKATKSFWDSLDQDSYKFKILLKSTTQEKSLLKCLCIQTELYSIKQQKYKNTNKLQIWFKKIDNSIFIIKEEVVSSIKEKI